MNNPILQSKILADLGVRHGFTTRLIGDVACDLDLWQEHSGLMADSLVTLKQVHADNVLVVDDSFRLPQDIDQLEFDAGVTAREDIVLGVRTADCVPILLYCSRPKVISAVHAGWKGALAGIVKRAVEAMQQHYACHPADILAVIGPCIQKNCYQVGDGVFDPFEERFGPKVAVDTGNDKHVDLVAANRHWLMGTGILEHNIEKLDYCTHCETELFFSYRREASLAGRQLAYISLL
jgi:YfiH family protein